MRKIKCNNSRAGKVLNNVMMMLGDCMAQTMGLALWETATEAERSEYRKANAAIKTANEKVWRIKNRLQIKAD